MFYDQVRNLNDVQIIHHLAVSLIYDQAWVFINTSKAWLYSIQLYPAQFRNICTFGH